MHYFFFSSILRLCPVGTAQKADSKEIKIRDSATLCQVLGVEAKRVLGDEFCSSLLSLDSAAHMTFLASGWFTYSSWSVTFPMQNVTRTVVMETDRAVLSIVSSLVGHAMAL